MIQGTGSGKKDGQQENGHFHQNAAEKKNLTQRELAEQLHITPQYLTRLFQRFVGSSVRSYISVLRISRAKELLISRPYTTLDGIAALCGYRDVSYFISVFRQQTGTTPKQFRKLYGI